MGDEIHFSMVVLVPKLGDISAGGQREGDVLAAVECGENGDVLVQVGEVSPSEGVREHYVACGQNGSIIFPH